MSFECSICMDPLENPAGGRNNLATRCGHIFHEDCMKIWLRRCPRQDKVCPSCRAPARIAHLTKCYPEEATETEASSPTTLTSPNATIQPPTMSQLFPDSAEIFGRESGGDTGLPSAGPITSAQLKFRHEALISDHEKLEAHFHAKQDELALATATNYSLMDEKILLEAQVKQNLEKINTLKSRAK